MWILRSEPSRGRAAKAFRVLPGSVKTMGRAPAADFVLPTTLASRIHCRLLVSPTGILEVEDLQSTNGTFVNGARVDRAALGPGDRLRVGGVELTVSVGS